MSYSLPDLPYAYDALEPHIDAQTMQIHHTKHHQAYVDKVNAAIAGTDYENQSLEAVIQARNTAIAAPDTPREQAQADNDAGCEPSHRDQVPLGCCRVQFLVDIHRKECSGGVEQR